MSHERDLEMTRQLFALLQGETPADCIIKPEAMPNLTPEQAWTVVWWLGNQYWRVSDEIERCGVCGELYDTACAGQTLDYGEAPYFFCEACMDGEVAEAKRAKGPVA